MTGVQPTITQQGDQIDFLRLTDQQQSTSKLLAHLLAIYDKKSLAGHFREMDLHGVDRDKLGRWQRDPQKHPIRFNEFEQKHIAKVLLPSRPKHWDAPLFTFIDLFAGIGGIRQGFEEIGGKCVFTSEFEERARRTYLANHYVDDAELKYFLPPCKPENKSASEPSSLYMDIRRITLSDTEFARTDVATQQIKSHIPPHDLLLAGFPCQPFSNACLLYTSPSPRDGLLSRMPSSA